MHIFFSRSRVWSGLWVIYLSHSWFLLEVVQCLTFIIAWRILTYSAGMCANLLIVSTSTYSLSSLDCGLSLNILYELKKTIMYTMFGKLKLWKLIFFQELPWEAVKQNYFPQTRYSKHLIWSIHFGNKTEVKLWFKRVMKVKPTV